MHVAGVPTMVAHGPADHTYEVAASAEDPASRVGRSRPIAIFGLFHGVLLCAKGLTREGEGWGRRPLGVSAAAASSTAALRSRLSHPAPDPGDGMAPACDNLSSS